jgi:hypothetical protein
MRSTLDAFAYGRAREIVAEAIEIDAAETSQWRVARR